MKKCAVAVILISLIAGLSHAEPQAKSNIEFLNSYAVLPAGHNLPFSEAVKVNDKVYLSGQIGIQPGTTKLVAGGIGPESKQTMENIRASLNAHGLSMKDIFKCTIMLADIKEWPEFNKVYTKFFSRPYPARSAFSTNGLALGARVEVECIATVPA